MHVETWTLVQNYAVKYPSVVLTLRNIYKTIPLRFESVLGSSKAERWTCSQRARTQRTQRDSNLLARYLIPSLIAAYLRRWPVARAPRINDPRSFFIHRVAQPAFATGKEYTRYAHVLVAIRLSWSEITRGSDRPIGFLRAVSLARYLPADVPSFFRTRLNRTIKFFLCRICFSIYFLHSFCGRNVRSQTNFFGPGIRRVIGGLWEPGDCRLAFHSVWLTHYGTRTIVCHIWSFQWPAVFHFLRGLMGIVITGVLFNRNKKLDDKRIKNCEKCKNYQSRYPI